MADIILSGWDDFINKAGRMPDVLQEEFAGEVEFSAERWSELSQKAAPRDQGKLAQGIHPAKVNDLEWNVLSNLEYSPYMEFGTKKRVKVQAGLESYAAQFKGEKQRGAAFAFQKMIYAWMDRKGIPIEKQWFVYISIVVNGVKPHPFLFIQEPIVEKEFIEHLQNIVDTEH